MYGVDTGRSPELTGQQDKLNSEVQVQWETISKIKCRITEDTQHQSLAFTGTYIQHIYIHTTYIYAHTYIYIHSYTHTYTHTIKTSIHTHIHIFMEKNRKQAMSWAEHLPCTYQLSLELGPSLDLFIYVVLWSFLYPWFQLHKGGIRLPVKAFHFLLSPKIQNMIWSERILWFLIIAWAELVFPAHWWQMARDLPGCWNDGRKRCSPPSPRSQKVGSCDLLLASVLCDSGLCTSIASLFWEHTF